MADYLWKYGVGAFRTVERPVLKADGGYATDSDWTPGAGDVKLSKDGAAPANIGTLPTYVGGFLWQFVLSDAEATVEHGVVVISDAALEDDAFDYETFGDGSAAWAGNLDTGVVGTGAIPEAAFAADTAKYEMVPRVLVDAAAGTPADRYGVAFYKNGQQVYSGITNAKLQVYTAAASPADLIALTALTQAGSTGLYFYNATTTERMTAGVGYFLHVEATIDGSTRSWDVQIGRDTTA